MNGRERAAKLRDRAHYFLSCALAYEAGPYVSALHRMLSLGRAYRARRALRLAEHYAVLIEKGSLTPPEEP